LGTRLLASEEALNQVTGFVLRPLGEFLLAGKSEPIRVSEVLGAIGDARKTALASAFADAFEAFQSHAWDKCVMVLEALLRAYPHDGPSRYFLSRALRFRAAPKEAPAVLIACVDKA
jgi:adenylate cyclase